MGWVSFFNDFSSEMIYPIIPIFLTSVLGAPIIVVGLIEGIADSASSFLKVISGWLSDKLQKRKIFIVFGYTLSAISKTIFTFAGTWQMVLTGRFLDRLGKGTRTSPRDALISESALKHQKGRAFGFHRAMDTLGAITGPLVAITLLKYFNDNYQLIFFLAAIPSFIGVILLILFVKEKKKKTLIHQDRSSSWQSFGFPFKKFLLVSLVFSVGNSSDAFLILRSQNLGLTVTMTIIAYTLFNLTYALLSTQAGTTSDKIGHKKILLSGYLIFSLVYLLFGIIDSGIFLWFLFPAYGFYMALTEGVSRAYMTHLVPKEEIATAFGLQQTVTGLCSFISSLIAGLLWTHIGPQAPFIFGSIMAIIATFIFIIAEKSNETKSI
ncbi:MAG: MFS transporter [Candidatus Falkowbacteria bacterium]|nr:MFS transporter [Candidatus Falkowbacteria bacterium]